MPSPSVAARGDKLSWPEVREIVGCIAEAKDEYCGIPVPIAGVAMVLESTHPARQFFATLDARDPLPAGLKVVNTWYNHRRQAEVYLWRESDGSLQWAALPEIHHFTQDMATMGCAVAWDWNAEMKALDTLREHLTAYQFKTYVLTGMFLETSKRSRVTYCFRRLRPTVAIGRGKQPDTTSILCCLCLHPIGFYADTWAGAMCPTDDLLSHLFLMRADEHFFWKKANQISPWRATAGL